MNKFMRAMQKASREGARAGYNLIMEDLAARRLAQRSGEPQNVAPREWDGEGLPPVGAICVTNLEHEWEWETVTVIAHDLGSVIIRRLEEEDFYVYDPVDASQLRPPRTPEQIATDNLKRLNAESEALRESAWRSPRLLVSSSDRSIDEDLNKP